MNPPPEKAAPPSNSLPYIAPMCVCVCVCVCVLERERFEILGYDELYWGFYFILFR